MHEKRVPTLTRAASTPNGSRERRDLERGVRAGRFVAVRAGVFVGAEQWQRADLDARHLLRIRAAAMKVDPRCVVSHTSALALHGVSYLRSWPTEVHVIDPLGNITQTRRGIAKHAGPLLPGDVEIVDGLAVTGIARTCIDVALSFSFEVAVAAVDECLRRGLVDVDGLAAAFARHHARRGRRAVERVLRFANELSESPGESWCRCVLRDLGAPAAEQQREFRDASGRIAFVDFWFEGSGVIVEFDGDQKYFQPRFAKGRTVSEIIVDERKRERRLLALPQVRDVVRVEWKDLESPWRLRSMAAAAGIPLG